MYVCKSPRFLEWKNCKLLLATTLSVNPTFLSRFTNVFSSIIWVKAKNFQLLFIATNSFRFHLFSHKCLQMFTFLSDHLVPFLSYLGSTCPIPQMFTFLFDHFIPFLFYFVPACPISQLFTFLFDHFIDWQQIPLSGVFTPQISLDRLSFWPRPQLFDKEAHSLREAIPVYWRCAYLITGKSTFSLMIMIMIIIKTKIHDWNQFYSCQFYHFWPFCFFLLGLKNF